MQANRDLVPRPRSTQPYHSSDNPIAAAEAFIKHSRRATRRLGKQLRKASVSRERSPSLKKPLSNGDLGLKPLHPVARPSSPYVVDPYANSLPSGTIAHGHVDIAKILHNGKPRKPIATGSSDAVLRNGRTASPVAPKPTPVRPLPVFKPIDKVAAPQSRSHSSSKSPTVPPIAQRKPSQPPPSSAKPNKQLTIQVRTIKSSL